MLTRIIAVMQQPLECSYKPCKARKLERPHCWWLLLPRQLDSMPRWPLSSPAAAAKLRTRQAPRPFQLLAVPRAANHRPQQQQPAPHRPARSAAVPLPLLLPAAAAAAGASYGAAGAALRGVTLAIGVGSCQLPDRCRPRPGGALWTALWETGFWGRGLELELIETWLSSPAIYTSEGCEGSTLRGLRA